MTNDQASESESTMDSSPENTGGVSGAMNLSINLPDNVRITTGNSSPANGNATGTIVAYAGDAPPSGGWLLCDGAEVNREVYRPLFDVIADKYGVGNGSTTFNLPDLRGRFPLGRDNMGNRSADRVTAAAAEMLGKGAGAETHTLTIDEMPRHSHGVDHAFDNTNGGLGTLAGYHVGSNTIRTSQANESSMTPLVADDEVGGHLIKNRGGGQEHNIMPPYQTVNYIIKT